MPAKKKIDSQKLIKAVESGKHQAEIMKTFGFNTATQLKKLLLGCPHGNWTGYATIIQTVFNENLNRKNSICQQAWQCRYFQGNNC